MDYNYKINKYSNKLNDFSKIHSNEKEEYKHKKLQYMLGGDINTLPDNIEDIKKNIEPNLYFLSYHGKLTENHYIIPSNIILILPACSGCSNLGKSFNSDNNIYKDGIKLITNNKDTIFKDYTSFNDFFNELTDKEKRNYKNIFINGIKYNIFFPGDLITDIELNGNFNDTNFHIGSFKYNNGIPNILDEKYIINNYKNIITFYNYEINKDYNENILIKNNNLNNIKWFQPNLINNDKFLMLINIYIYLYYCNFIKKTDIYNFDDFIIRIDNYNPKFKNIEIDIPNKININMNNIFKDDILKLLPINDEDYIKIINYINNIKKNNNDIYNKYFITNDKIDYDKNFIDANGKIIPNYYKYIYIIIFKYFYYQFNKYEKYQYNSFLSIEINKISIATQEGKYRLILNMSCQGYITQDICIFSKTVSFYNDPKILEKEKINNELLLSKYGISNFKFNHNFSSFIEKLDLLNNKYFNKSKIFGLINLKKINENIKKNNINSTNILDIFILNNLKKNTIKPKTLNIFNVDIIYNYYLYKLICFNPNYVYLYSSNSISKINTTILTDMINYFIFCEVSNFVYENIIRPRKYNKETLDFLYDLYLSDTKLFTELISILIKTKFNELRKPLLIGGNYEKLEEERLKQIMEYAKIISYRLKNKKEERIRKEEELEKEKLKQITENAKIITNRLKKKKENKLYDFLDIIFENIYLYTNIKRLHKCGKDRDFEPLFTEDTFNINLSKIPSIPKN